MYSLLIKKTSSGAFLFGALTTKFMSVFMFYVLVLIKMLLVRGGKYITTESSIYLNQEKN
jgi:hypothetical protein